MSLVRAQPVPPPCDKHNTKDIMTTLVKNRYHALPYCVASKWEGGDKSNLPMVSVLAGGVAVYSTCKCGHKLWNHAILNGSLVCPGSLIVPGPVAYAIAPSDIEDEVLKPVLGNPWSVQAYESGSVCISTSESGTPYVYVYYSGDKSLALVSGSEETSSIYNDHFRQELADDLCYLLNGGHPPAWLTWCRAMDGRIVTPTGGIISVLAARVLPDDDNGRLAWRPSTEPQHLDLQQKVFKHISQHCSK